MRWNKIAIFIVPLLFVFLIGGVWLGYRLYYAKTDFINPLVKTKSQTPKALPLNKYTIDNLSNFDFKVGTLVIEEKIADFDSYSSYLFTYEATGGKISGQLNVPHSINRNEVILLIRGYVPLEIYETGVGTKAAAGVFAENGYITLSPDFLGYGQSDPDLEDSWESRFIKPVQVIELIKTIRQADFAYSYCIYQKENPNLTNLEGNNPTCEPTRQEYSLGIWAHSNGGQIALSVLEVLEESIPTTLWAPVTAPFPYSVLFFSDEYADEGKATRKWLAQFEEDYDVFDFSITQHLDRLQGPIILHHGTADEAALVSWSLEFIDKVKAENKNREEEELEATSSAGMVKEPIAIDLITYPGADHNLRPVWNTVIARDLEFFAQSL